MQNSFLKNITSLVFVLFVLPGSLLAQSDNSLLARADSLFQQKRYTQSFELYRTIFEQKKYTPAMLLKMAYIEEGLNQIAQSVYYLNLYYMVTQDESAQIKLSELSQKYRLEGYEIGPSDKILTVYRQHHDSISMVLAALIVFLFTLMMIQRFRYHKIPGVAGGFIVITSIVALAHVNFGDRHHQAIIANNNTYIMDGPSAGASVVSIVRDGHRVRVTGKKDVWLRVSWGEGEGYIKENNVLPVEL